MTTLPLSIPNIFANATVTIPLSQLDTDFSTLANAINGIGNGSTAIANLTLQGGNVTIAGGTANGGNLAMIGTYLAGYAKNINLNVKADTPITIQMPTTNYLLTDGWFVQETGTSANVQINICSGANFTGTQILQIVQPALTAGVNTGGTNHQNSYEAAAIGSPATRQWVTYTTLYANVSTTEAATGTGSIYLYARPAP